MKTQSIDEAKKVQVDEGQNLSTEPAESPRPALADVLLFARKAALSPCARVDGDQCCFFVRDILDFCVACHARVVLDDEMIAFRQKIPSRNDGLFRAIEILGGITLSNEHGEREAWPAIREAIKSIEAEI